MEGRAGDSVVRQLLYAQGHWGPLGFAYLPRGACQQGKHKVVMRGLRPLGGCENTVLEGGCQVSLEPSPLMASGCQHGRKKPTPLPWVHVPRAIVQSLEPLPTPDSTWLLQVTQVDKKTRSF